MSITTSGQMDYYGNVRSDLLGMIQGRNLKLLEVGCGAGSTLLAAKEQGIAAKIVGAEFVDEVARVARSRGVKKVYTGDYALAVKKILAAEGKFDAVLFGDVLEHMVDPWAALALTQNLLVDGGQVVASVPNIRYWRVMYNVFLRGNFRYEANGIMDKTHLRFFCRRNIVEMVGEHYQIVDMRANMPKSGKILNAISLGFLKEFGTLQYHVAARKKS